MAALVLGPGLRELKEWTERTVEPKETSRRKERDCRQVLLGEGSALESLPTHLLCRDPYAAQPPPQGKGNPRRKGLFEMLYFFLFFFFLLLLSPSLLSLCSSLNMGCPNYFFPRCRRC